MKKWIAVTLSVTAVLCFSILPLGTELENAPKDGLPINVTISYQDSTVSVNWDEVDNAAQYYIYSQDDPYAEFVLIDSTALTTWNGNYSHNKKFFYVTTEVIIAPEGFVYVKGGTFQMGDHFDPEGNIDELPTHSVALSNFYIGATEVTQAEWSAYMPAENWSSYGTGNNYPVYYVSWYKVIKYCNLRSIAEGLTPVYTINSSTNPANWGTVPTSTNSTWNAAICNWSVNGYRLPSEAEWEYAARGGTHNTDNLRYSGCNLETELTNYAWYSGNYTGASHPVGTKLPNQLGIYDMSGNEWEWCWDWYGSTYYTICNNLGTVTNPHGPATGSYRVVRGGYWIDNGSYCRVAIRLYTVPSDGYDGVGFRLSRTP